MKVTINGREYDAAEQVGETKTGLTLHRYRAVPYWIDRGDDASQCDRFTLVTRYDLASWRGPETLSPCSRCFPAGPP